MDDERQQPSRLRKVEASTTARQQYDRGALLALRALSFAILAPLFVLALCFALPAWLWRASGSLPRRQVAVPQQEDAMSISTTLRSYLEDSGRPYELMHHPRTLTSMETAQAAHVPGGRLAKSVLVEDEEGYVLAVIPSTHRLLFGALREQFGNRFGLATERDVAALFKECEVGAIPPFGHVYGLRVIVDDSLFDADDVYCESGDHTELVHLSGQNFRALMRQAEHGKFSRHV